jgi:hypothetical protein
LRGLIVIHAEMLAPQHYLHADNYIGLDPKIELVAILGYLFRS